MKKNLLFIPLLAGIVLCGCEDNSKPKKVNNIVNQELEEYVAAPENFAGYHRVFQPEEGKTYIIGLHHRKTVGKETVDQMYFINGDAHRDDVGEYPYYFACEKYDMDVAELEENKIAKFSVEYTTNDDGVQKYRIKIDSTTSVYGYNGYLQIYGDRSAITAIIQGEEQVTGYKTHISYKFDPSPTCTYDNKLEGEANNPACPCTNEFYSIKSYGYMGTESLLNGIAGTFCNQCEEDEYSRSVERTVIMGTSDIYSSVSPCVNEAYYGKSYICHFYEKDAE